MRVLFACFLMMLFAPHMAQAEILVSDATAFETAMGQKVGAALMTIQNTGKEDDRLISAASGVSARVELHTMHDENGVMKMREIKEIKIPAGEKITLTHDGMHLMLMDLREPLKAGKDFAISLTFEKAGTRALKVETKSRSALKKMMDAPEKKTEKKEAVKSETTPKVKAEEDHKHHD